MNFAALSGRAGRFHFQNSYPTPTEKVLDIGALKFQHRNSVDEPIAGSL